jgi:hypothetical protein
MSLDARRSPSTAALGHSAACLLAGALALAAHDASAQVLADPQRSWQPPAQAGLALSLESQVVRRPIALQPRGGVHEWNPQPQQQASLNLEFRRASAHQQAKDLLKVQLTADSVLNFRPRGGGLVVTYRSQF